MGWSCCFFRNKKPFHKTTVPYIMANIQNATLGTGCFWCTEAVFNMVDGIEEVISGYSGGHLDNPTYEDIGTKTSGHAEVVRITFDADKISFEKLLEMFWRSHDPTTLNRQGNDVGPQYRSVIYYHNEEQKVIAEKSKQSAEEVKLWDDPIVTEIAPLINWYPAEDYHQKYFDRVGSRNPYCTFVVGPKVEKFKKVFEDNLKK